MSDALTALENQYDFLTDHIDAMEDACNGDATLLHNLRNAYAKARHNYQAALNNAFRENDIQVASLTQQLNDEQKMIINDLNDLSKIASIIDQLTKAVALGAKLVALAA
jgi:hypothetical protein